MGWACGWDGGTGNAYIIMEKALGKVYLEDRERDGFSAWEVAGTG
jgi:hypothetical protein